MASQDLASDARRPWPKPRNGAQAGPQDAAPPGALPGLVRRRLARDPRPAGRRTRALPPRLREALVVAAPAVAIMALGWRQRWVGDGGMVYARTARQILAGNGPVFNVGERAEASTGALWQWLVAGCSYLAGRDPSVVAAVLGVLLTGAGYALAVAAARRAVRPLSGARLLPLGMLVLLAVKADWDFASSGLESGLTTGWIALAWWYLVAARTAARPRRLHAAAAVIGLGPLVRPEFALVSAVFLAALWVVVRPRPRRALALLATAAALPAAYEVFRAGYYGVLLPLPAVTRATSGANWPRGLAYLMNIIQPYHLLLPLLLLLAAAVAGLSRSTLPAVPAELIAPPVAGLVSWLYVCRAGGDAMHGRLLLPGLLLLMLPLCAVPARRVMAAATAGLAGWAVVCALLWRPPATTGEPYSIVDEQRAYTVATGDAHPVSELAHARRAEPLLTAEIGARGAGARVLLMRTPGSSGAFVSLPLSHRTGSRLAGSYELIGYNGIVTPLNATAIDPLGLAYPLAAHQADGTDGSGGGVAAGAGGSAASGAGGSAAGSAMSTVGAHGSLAAGAADTAGSGGRIGATGSGAPAGLDPAWIVADFTDPGTTAPAGVDPARLRAARHALTCGRLADLQASVRAPLTPARFWHNLTGAWSRTGFRFPADPVRAERVLCRG